MARMDYKARIIEASLDRKVDEIKENVEIEQKLEADPGTPGLDRAHRMVDMAILLTLILFLIFILVIFNRI